MEANNLSDALSEREQIEYAIIQKNQENYGSQLGLIESKLDIAKQGVSLMDKALDVYKESKQIELNVAKIHAQTNVQLAKIAAKFTFCQEALLHTFGERNKALGAHYNALAHALETDDRECIIAALHGISSIVVQNPLESFTKIIEAWDNTSETLELDF